MDIANSNEEKKGKGLKVFIIVLIVLIAIPLSIFSFIYRNNQNFKNNTNKTLAKMPGGIGAYFKNIPTEYERSEKISYLSKYFLDLEPGVAADKLYIIKKEDEKLYTNIVKDMNSISLSKTEEITVKVRDMETRKDLLYSVHEEAKIEEEAMLLSEITRIERQDIGLSVMEIEQKYGDREFLRTLDKVNPDILGQIFYYTDPHIREYVLATLNINTRLGVERIISEKRKEAENLLEITKAYETKSVDIAASIIGNTDTYSMDKLAIIYKSLSVKKSAEILLKVNDDDFIEELFKYIIEEEDLEDIEITLDEDNNPIEIHTSITKDIGKAMAFLEEYNRKITSLVAVYEKMEPANIAQIVEEMIGETNTITSLQLEEKNILELTDRDIILDVLSKMKNQTFSKVLDLMKPKVASELTSLMAIPETGN